MLIPDLPFGPTDWSEVEPIAHRGKRGLAYSQTRSLGAIRVRMLEYTPVGAKLCSLDSVTAPTTSGGTSRHDFAGIAAR